jgi:hypothetical protein
MSNDPTQHTNVSHGTDTNNRIGDGSDLEVADPAEVLFAQRDSDGEPVPVPQKIPGRDQALEVRPPTEGFYNQYLNPVPSDDNEQVAAMLSKGFPGLDVDAADVENGLLIFGLETAVEMLKRAGGYDMYSALQDQQGDDDMEYMQQMMTAMGVGGEDMSMGEFFEALNEIDMDDVEEAADEAEGGADGQQDQSMSPGPARPNGG